MKSIYLAAGYWRTPGLFPWMLRYQFPNNGPIDIGGDN